MPGPTSRERHSLRFRSKLPTLTPWPRRQSSVYLIITRLLIHSVGSVASKSKKKEIERRVIGYSQNISRLTNRLIDRYFRKRMLARAGIRVGR